MTRWTPDAVRTLLEYMESGAPVADAYKLFPGRTQKAVINKVSELRIQLAAGATPASLISAMGTPMRAAAAATPASGPQLFVPDAPAEDGQGKVLHIPATASPASQRIAQDMMQLAQENELLKTELAALRQRAQPIPQAAGVQTVRQGEGYTVESHQDTESAEVRWRRAEEDNARRIENAIKGKKFKVNFEDDWIMVAFMSDLHIAPGTPVDLRRMREDAELIRDTPRCFAMLAGDMVDNHIKHRAAVLAARSQPADQWAHFEHLLEIIYPKVVAAVAGNHDLWTDQIGGVDMLQRIFQSGRGVRGNMVSTVAYSKYQAYIDLAVGRQLYKLGMIHQFRMNSSYNQTHAVKQWLRLGEESFDVGVIGHHHEAALEAFVHKNQVCWACRPGAYQITSSYSAQLGYNNSLPTCPTFVFRGDMRSIIGFVDLREAVQFCELQRAK